MTFLAGYLGAGKTTLLNAYLARTDQPVAVLVNDVGEVNIDARLVRRRSGDTIELTDGCVCCSISQGFGEALDQLRSRPVPPSHVLVELSGVSVPHRVLPWTKSAGFMLDGVITVVDAANYQQSMLNPVSAGTITAQLHDADLVLVSKLDLVDDETARRVRNDIGTVASDAEILDLRTDLAAALLELGGRRPGGIAELPPASLFDTHVVETRPIPTQDVAQMLDLLHSLPPDVVRAKGIGRTPSGDLLLLQRVGTRSSVTPLPVPEQQATTELVTIST